jgi:hypothetical protein
MGDRFTDLQIYRIAALADNKITYTNQIAAFLRHRPAFEDYKIAALVRFFTNEH